MANYSLVVGSKFSPFSYQELLQPALMATQAHQDIENKYAELATKANVWEKLVNDVRDKDSQAYKTYKKFSNDLENLANSLAEKGLNPSSRIEALKMFSRYSSEITPIAEAYNNRAKKYDEQRKALLANPSLMFDTDFSTIGIDKLIDNPDLGYTPISGNELYTKGNTAARAISLRNLSYGQRKALGDQYFELTKRQGYSSQEAANWLAGKYDIPELREAINRIHSEANTGILSNADRNRANNYIIDGIMSGISYSEDKQYREDKDYITPYQRYQMNKGNKQEETVGFSPRIIEGVSGEVNKTLTKLKGLRKTEDGYSTIELDNKLKELEKAKKEYATYMNDKNEKAYITYENYKRLTENKSKSVFGNNAYAALASTSSNYGEPSGYRKYRELKDKINKAQLEYDKVKKDLDLIETKYSHLGGTPYDRLYIGSILEDLQEKQENTSFTLNLKDSDYNNVREGIANILRGFTEKSIDSGSVGVRSLEDNKMLDYDDIQDMIKSENLGQLALKVSGGNDNKLKMVYKGKEYSIEGVEQVTKFNRDLKATNDFLKDFSSNVTKSITPISDQTLYDIKTKGISNVSINNANLKSIEGTNFKGTTLYNKNTGELIKVMVDSNGNVIAENSLSDELLNKGANRDSYFINMANRGLRNLTPLLASDAD